MQNLQVNWTEEEFKAYILIYAAQSNQLESDKEKGFIGSRFNDTLLINMYKEIDSDNDYQRIQKIMTFIEGKKYSNEDLKKILSEIKDLYLCDGTFDSIEQSVYHFMKKLFKIY